MNVALFNDTASFPHLGCMAVSDAHARMLGRRRHHVKQRFFFLEFHDILADGEEASIAAALRNKRLEECFDEVDAVIVNGEGTIHHGAGHYLLAILGAAQKRGKQTLLVNAVYEANTAFEDVLRRLDDFTVRETRSASFAKSRNIPCRVVLDSCFEAHFSGEALTDLSGKIAITDWHIHRDRDVGDAIRYVSQECGTRGEAFPFERADAASVWQRAVPTLARSDIVVTGRHHGACFALKAHRPFVALPSNTHKIEGFAETIGLSIPIVSTPQAAIDALHSINGSADQFSSAFAYVASMMPFTTFQALGDGTSETTENEEVTKLATDLIRFRQKASVV
jgi:polysaccharide pyruvyl transferase WcaK-like protein